MAAAVHPAAPPPTMAIRLILRSGSIDSLTPPRRRGGEAIRAPSTCQRNRRKRGGNARISATDSIGCRRTKIMGVFSMSPSLSLVRSKHAALLVVPLLLLFGCKEATKEAPTAAAPQAAPGTVHPEIWP